MKNCLLLFSQKPFLKLFVFAKKILLFFQSSFVAHLHLIILLGDAT